MSGGPNLISGGKNHANRGVGEANHPANQVSNPMEGLLANPFTPKAKSGANPTSNHANHANLHPNLMANQGSNLMKGVLPHPIAHANLQTMSNQHEPRNSTHCQIMAYSHPISS